jgi:phosphatidylinositol alpha-1,6-mannosyltransferase
MSVLIVTDHRFLRHRSGIYDTFTYDPEFFEDYIKVFQSAEVLCRMTPTESLPARAFPAGGPKVRFIGVSDVRRAQWFLCAGNIARVDLLAAIARVDSVIVRVPSELGWHAARAAMRWQKPYMIEVIGDPAESLLTLGGIMTHRLLARHAAWRLRQLARGATVACYVNRLTLPRRYPVSPGTPFDLISDIRLAPNWITRPREVKSGTAPLRIISVGSLMPGKRTVDIIFGCHQVINRGFPVEFHVVGDGPCRRNCEITCQKLGLRNSVIFHGHVVGRENVFRLLDQCDLFVMASATEGLPRAVLEAMARGLPVIGARANGTVELLREPDLFPIGDSGKMAQLIIDLIQSPARLTQMSRHSIETARAYTNDKLSPRRIRLYRLLRDAAVRHGTPCATAHA